MTRARAKRMREALQRLVMELQETEPNFTNGDSTIIHVIRASEDPEASQHKALEPWSAASTEE